MRKLLTLIALVIALLAPAAALSGQAAAINIFPRTCDAGGAGSGSTVCKSVDDQNSHNNQNPIITIIKGAIDIISFLVGVVAVIGLVISGIRLITAGGDSNSVASARSGIIYSLIGIAVVALAQTIVVFVLGK